MTHPYKSLERKAFWKTGVADGNVLEINDLWTPKFPISRDGGVITAGSCFAQHISRAMIQNGFTWIDSEPAPDYIPEAQRRKFGYGVFSFRTGNIYTTRLLRQWVEAAFGVIELDDELWEKDGRFYDPLRPAIEPNGFASRAECLALRAHSLAAIRAALCKAELFVFTLGLTESWVNSRTGLCYAACPGTLAGTFDASEHVFDNLRYPEILADMTAVLDLVRQHNPGIHYLLTVSPVPLTATASDNHVLPATIYSKSVLRAVAGDLAATREDTEYFPSFEIISSFPYRGMFYLPNQREVASAGVAHVMTHFFAGLARVGSVDLSEVAAVAAPATPSDPSVPVAEEAVDDDIQCEEALLEAFAK